MDGRHRLACILCALALAACGGASTMDSDVRARGATVSTSSVAAGPATTSADLFDWAADVYPDNFSGTPLVGQAGRYSFRFYPGSSTYVGTDDEGGVFVLGPISGNSLLQVGTVADFEGRASEWRDGLGSFPGIGSIWWGDAWIRRDPAHANRIGLMLSPGLSAERVAAQRAVAPKTLFFFNFNATSSLPELYPGVVPQAAPESYYLHDTLGRRILIWPPDSYLFNLTKAEVAEFVAQQAYAGLVAGNFSYDGIFFDNFQHSLPALTQDFYGNSVQISSRNDGVADEPLALSRAWARGVQHVIETLRAMYPTGYVTGHISAPLNPADLAAFNGNAFVGGPVNIREGKTDFASFFHLYKTWQTQSVAPHVTLVQSSPPNQVAYGYSYRPSTVMAPALLAWAQKSYANMRFGLGIALMENGFFSFDIGDTSSDTQWWYDEYDFDLGLPMSKSAVVGAVLDSSQLVANGSFSDGFEGWFHWVTDDGAGNATFAPSTIAPTPGGTSAEIHIISPPVEDWHIYLDKGGLGYVQGRTYAVTFSTLADRPLTLGVASIGGPPAYAKNGLSQRVAVGTTWTSHRLLYTSATTDADGHLQFRFESGPGRVWLTDVRVTAQPEQVLRRDFDKGVVLLNGTSATQVVAVGPGLKRFSGSQAPKYSVIVDDGAASFVSSGAAGGAGSWSVATVDSGFFMQAPPYFHAWMQSLHQTSERTDRASWTIAIPEGGAYTFTTWLPAAPAASLWTKNASYSLVAKGAVVATTTLDQSVAVAGDQWWTLFTDVQLQGGQNVEIRIANAGSGSLVADAIEMTSGARYNDGQAVGTVTLAPYDAILLQRTAALTASRPVQPRRALPSASAYGR